MLLNLCNKSGSVEINPVLVDNKTDKAGKCLNLSVFSGFIFISCVVYCLIRIKLHK